MLKRKRMHHLGKNDIMTKIYRWFGKYLKVRSLLDKEKHKFNRRMKTINANVEFYEKDGDHE